MRPISRTALGAATAAVLAVTAIAPSVAAPPDDATAKKPLTGSAAGAAKDGGAVTVTLVTGDKVLVSTDSSGASSATALPREDGTVPLVQTRQSGKDLYVYPDTAVGALAAGTVDEELFNVTGLIRQGYDDAHSTTVPLIATYGQDTARGARPTPRGAERGMALDAIDGVALKADKKRTAAFWADITAPRSRSAAGLEKLWLDRKVEASLDTSTKQVGADLAWAAGYDGKGTKVAVLDTGADAEHPDLKGRITASENFTDSDSTDDRQGHGTHTLSTVGGSGAASDGKKKGVAPGTGLLVGKVLNDSGSGAASWIIAGMQWAVDNKADVVSMSLGSATPTDCTDPMSLAAEELGKSKDTLFVVAAGNIGPSLNTVSSPGCAPSVLTVGAVDRDDSTANFSSLGPAIVSHTLKPEISAPGVGISAAAAGGRGPYAYRSMSGTSMATPHVAGAAAIVKQRHPDWTAQQVKAALVSSAKSAVPGDVRETGAGRLDVARAIDTSVLGSPAVQGGTFNWPQDKSDRTSVDVPYTNLGKKPVKLSLKVAGVTGNDGSAVRSGIAGLGRKSVTVPAGATVRVPLELAPDARLDSSQYGDVTGRVLATADGVEVATPFSLYVAPETVTLRVKLIDRTGKPADGVSSLDVIGTDTSSGERRFNEGAADQTYQLRPGAYFVSSFIASPDPKDATGQLVESVGYLARPQLNVTEDTTVVLDARKAHKLTVKTEDRATETRTTTLAFGRSWDDTWLHSGSLSGTGLVKNYLVDVQGKPRDGEFEFDSFWRAYAPQIEKFSLVGGPALHPRPAGTGSVNLDGTGSAEVVDAGTGTAAELAAAGAKGRIALVKVAAAGVTAQARAAEAAGAKALLVHRSAAGDWKPSTGYGSAPLPVLGLRADEAAVLIAALGEGPAEVSWKATAVSPFVYNLAFPETGQITSDRTYKVRDKKLGSVTATHDSMGVAADFVDTLMVTRPYGGTYSVAGFDTLATPGKRTEYYSAGDSTWRKMLASSFPWGEFMTDRTRTYRAGDKRTEEWYRGLLTPGTPRDAAGREVLAAERQDNVIGVAPGFVSDTEHVGEQGSFGDIGGMRLTSGGEVIGSSGYPFGAFTVPAEDRAYELTMSTTKIGQPAAVWKRSTATETTWKFRSERKADVYSQGIPLLFPRYDVPSDGMKTLPATDGQRIGLTVTGHAGYTPGRLTGAKVSFSYDGGRTWSEAVTGQQAGRWSATVNHKGASGKPVTLRTELTDANGNTVVQTVNDAYVVR
ncbi:S8 family serine peptidase [Streptomyces sp. BE147]|uniref:S8 family serine peptidase n=1 Tax=Streptomyces sp. BE147 TaxID=3002524 RepID=UPI002E770670|nr:S8 family serine peptidase [Streptomyces sp. BE147]MEE1737755.1 S8 family serine peptidase [Streptomyces sp. BE147]